MSSIVDINYRTEDKSALKKANQAWTECISKKFVSQWLAGSNLNITEVCSSELEAMNELDEKVYPEGVPKRVLHHDLPY